MADAMKIALNGMFWDKPTTGTGQYLRALLRALLQRDIDNDYCLIAPQRLLENVPPCVMVHPAPSRLSENFAKVWFEQISFVRACQNERAALAHVPYFAPPVFSRTPIIATIHDLIPMVLPLYRGSVLVRAYTQLAALGARRAHAIIADSECSKRDIVARLNIDPARVQVIHLAADENYRPADAAQIDAVRRKYALPDKFILYLGGFDQRKNVRVVIQAFARLRDLHAQGFRLVLGGKILGANSEFFPNPHRIARDAGLPDDAIQSIGWVEEDDKPALYSSAIAFAFASVYEGFGLPPLEAMACGTPVICSSASSLPEVVGDAAITIDPNDVDAWAEAMRVVLTDDARRSEMRERGIAQAKKFSWRKCAEETLAVYNSISMRQNEIFH
jgi:glycosyltransferase involved in cell wall biosynthesis